jgi:hypothetical protein
LTEGPAGTRLWLSSITSRRRVFPGMATKSATQSPALGPTVLSVGQ